MSVFRQDDPFTRGAQAGIARLERYDLSWDDGSIEEALAMTRRIEEESGDYVRVRLMDRMVWVSALKVQINYPAGRCDKHQLAANTAAARGIGEGCKQK